ncbi:MAG TPA: hypothetical protein VG817_07155 [Gemmatimonadales bacterium]|nr:hypothetical protein [Gemmatimonadales bacterium]
MIHTRHALVRSFIDYAGLFPPAGLGMQDAVQRYADYQRRTDRWALARLVVPVARLGEFEAALAALSPVDRNASRFPVAALAGLDLGADRAAIEAFNQRHGGQHGVQVESIELRVASVADIDAAGERLGTALELYCELPLSADLPSLVSATRRIGARAKIRMGGVKPVDFPAPEAVLAFLASCAAERLACKATAGLHHPVRGPAPLTYEPGSARTTMYGYINLVLAAAALWHRRPESQAYELLRLPDRASLQIGSEGVTWGGVKLSAGEIDTTRRHFLLAIGSCSFTEPMDELAEMTGPIDAYPATGAA